MMKKYTKGFTLIELLVVIAIIGILSSVVLVSLNTARNKGSDAKVQSQLGGMRAAAEIVYSNSGSSYGTADPASTACPATANSLTANADIVAYRAGMPTPASLVCTVTPTTRAAYAFAYPLVGTGTAGDYWCVDSAGTAGKITITAVGTVALTDDTCVAIDAK